MKGSPWFSLTPNSGVCCQNMVKSVQGCYAHPWMFGSQPHLNLIGWLSINANLTSQTECTVIDLLTVRRYHSF